MSVERARQELARGQHARAVHLLWEALGPAQDRDDARALSEIHGLAHAVVLHGDQRAAAEAQRIMAGIEDLHPQTESSGSQATLSRIPMTTGNDPPGMRITEIITPLFAMTVRSRDMFTTLGARLKGASVGGELAGMTAALEQSRTRVLARLQERAGQVGADGVIALRFDVSEMAGTWTEICVYSTAVRALPLPEQATSP